MSGFDRLDDTYPHGTLEGYRGGCRGAICSAVASCLDVHVRYQGDYSFRRAVNAGEDPQVLFAAEVAERAAVAARDKIANRAPRITHEPKPKKAGKPRTKDRPKKRERASVKPKGTRERYSSVSERMGDEIVRLHGEGVHDRKIGELLGVSRNTVMRVRHDKGLPAIVQDRSATAGRPRRDRRGEVAALHAKGLTDAAIAAEMGLSTPHIASIRRAISLTANNPDGTAKKAQRLESRRDAVRAAYLEGLRDVQIAERLNLTEAYVGTIRRELQLRPHPMPRTHESGPRRDRRPEIRAAYERGLTDTEISKEVGLSVSEVGRLRRSIGLDSVRPVGRPRAAHVELARVELVDVRVEVAAEQHGTADGYEHGCRKRSECPAKPSCVDAALEVHRQRRHAADVAVNA